MIFTTSFMHKMHMLIVAAHMMLNLSQGTSCLRSTSSSHAMRDLSQGALSLRPTRTVQFSMRLHHVLSCAAAARRKVALAPKSALYRF